MRLKLGDTSAARSEVEYMICRLVVWAVSVVPTRFPMDGTASETTV